MKVTDPQGFTYEILTAADMKLFKEMTATNGNGSSSTSCLNDTQYHAYSFLVDNDNDNGVHYKRYAESAGLSAEAANERLHRLVELGCATKNNLAAGKFRAIS